MYFYRFLRTKADNFHPSEIDGDIEFYTSDECGTNRDFTWNKPVKDKMDAGQSVQLLFGMDNLEDAVNVLKCFACYKRVLARFDLSTVGVSYTINLDEQVNERVGSKYIMSDYNGRKVSIPNADVQVLSTSGWVDKSEATNALLEIDSLLENQYEQLIANA